jgi:hypothetical protein
MNKCIIINQKVFQEKIKKLVNESNLEKNIPSVNSQLAESLLKFEKEMLKHCYYISDSNLNLL